MKTVLHIAKFYPPDWGGIESVTEALASGCASKGWHSVVVCFSKKSETKTEIVKNVEIVRCKTILSLWSQPISLVYFFWVIRKIREANVIHVHAPNYLAYLALIFARTSGKKIIVQWHCDVVGKGLVEKLLRPLVHAVLNRADSIVATTPPYAETSQQLAEFSSKISVIPYGIEDQAKLPVKEPLSESLRASGLRQHKVVTAIGRLVGYKGFENLIRAAVAVSPEIKIVLVGIGPLEIPLKLLISELGVSDRFLMVGQLSQGELRYLLAQTTIFCLPSISRAEAFGVVQLEAMCFGLPLVSTDIEGSGVSWVNRNGESGIVIQSGSVKAIVDALNLLIDDHECLERLAYGSRARYEAEFTKSLMIDRWVQVYS